MECNANPEVRERLPRKRAQQQQFVTQRQKSRTPKLHARSSTASQERSPRLQEAQYLKWLVQQVHASGKTWSNKLSALLHHDRRAAAFFTHARGDARTLAAMQRMHELDNFVLLAAVSAGQSHVLCPDEGECEHMVEHKLSLLAERLAVIEQFYDTVGGVLGYQATALEQMEEAVASSTELALEYGCDASERNNSSSFFHQHSADAVLSIHVPRGRNLADEPGVAKEATRWGIAALPHMAEIYPLGGAGDRLGLQHEETGESLPVALLNYDGRSLLECLVRDLEAREWLYFKLFGEQIQTPLAIMTSEVKRNHEHILQLCQSKNWFNRGRNNFVLFQQPLVPVCCLHNEGEWVLDAPLEPSVKPGGHGVLWKLMHDNGVLPWLQHTKGRTASIVRQISNPIAGTDSTLLCLAGVGIHENRNFGFVSCERKPGASEGVNVLVERQNARGEYEYAVSNIEYTEFQRYGIVDEDAGSTFSHFGNGSKSGVSRYPANTNVLFARLQAIEAAVSGGDQHGALPGMLINLGSKAKARAHDGTLTRAGRLECSMQNIADVLTTRSSQRLTDDALDALDTFLVYNRRQKVTSSAKRQREHGSTQLAQTPDGSFLDYLQNALEALQQGGWSVPRINTAEEYVREGPGTITVLHPALGPLWNVIAQKLRGGKLRRGSELRLDVAEADIEALDLDGSMRVEAECPLGQTEPTTSGENVLTFRSEYCAKIRVHNVHVVNEGVCWDVDSNCFWMDRLTRSECLRIRLFGNAELDAEGVRLEGDEQLDVPCGYRMVLRPSSDGSSARTQWLEQLPCNGTESSWWWVYEFDGDDIVLSITRNSNSI